MQKNFYSAEYRNNLTSIFEQFIKTIEENKKGVNNYSPPQS